MNLSLLTNNELYTYKELIKSEILATYNIEVWRLIFTGKHFYSKLLKELANRKLPLQRY